MSDTANNTSDDKQSIDVVVPAQDMSTLEFYKAGLERMLRDPNLPEERKTMVRNHLKLAAAAPVERREEAYAVSYVMCAADTAHLPIPEASIADVQGEAPLPAELPVPKHVIKWQPIFVQLGPAPEQSKASQVDL